MADREHFELLAGYPVVVELPVAWGEMDSYRHVNNTVYFRYFESDDSLEPAERKRTGETQRRGPLTPGATLRSGVCSGTGRSGEAIRYWLVALARRW